MVIKPHEYRTWFGHVTNEHNGETLSANVFCLARQIYFSWGESVHSMIYRLMIITDRHGPIRPFHPKKLSRIYRHNNNAEKHMR